MWIEMSSVKMTQAINLSGKRQLRNILQPLLQIKKKMKEEKIDQNSTISFSKFKQLLRENEFFTTWCQTSLQSEVKECLIDVFNKNIKEGFSGGSSTQIMSMLSTTAVG